MFRFSSTLTTNFLPFHSRPCASKDWSTKSAKTEKEKPEQGQTNRHVLVKDTAWKGKEENEILQTKTQHETSQEQRNSR